MALILLGKTQCSICDIVIRGGEALVATTHFVSDEADPLWRFSDSAMHRSCFLEWPLRKEFIAKYNATVGTRTAGNGTYHQMEDDGNILVLKRSEES